MWRIPSECGGGVAVRLLHLAESAERHFAYFWRSAASQQRGSALHDDGCGRANPLLSRRSQAGDVTRSSRGLSSFMDNSGYR